MSINAYNIFMEFGPLKIFLIDNALTKSTFLFFSCKSTYYKFQRKNEMIVFRLNVGMPDNTREMLTMFEKNSSS